MFFLLLDWLYLLFRLLPRLTIRQGSNVSAFFPFFNLQAQRDDVGLPCPNIEIQQSVRCCRLVGTVASLQKTDELPAPVIHPFPLKHFCLIVSSLDALQFGMICSRSLYEKKSGKEVRSLDLRVDVEQLLKCAALQKIQSHVGLCNRIRKQHLNHDLRRFH